VTPWRSGGLPERRFFRLDRMFHDLSPHPIWGSLSGPSSPVKEFLEQVSDANGKPDGTILFRGQPNDFPLLPKLFRKPNTVDKVGEVERLMLANLKRIAAHLRLSEPENDWDWLSLGQHHGLQRGYRIGAQAR
jgi:FRG domain